MLEIGVVIIYIFVKMNDKDNIMEIKYFNVCLDRMWRVFVEG